MKYSNKFFVINDNVYEKNIFSSSPSSYKRCWGIILWCKIDRSMALDDLHSNGPPALYFGFMPSI